MSFWKKHTNHVPGSIKATHSGTTASIVIGATYPPIFVPESQGINLETKHKIIGDKGLQNLISTTQDAWDDDLADMSDLSDRKSIAVPNVESNSMATVENKLNATSQTSTMEPTSPLKEKPEALTPTKQSELTMTSVSPLSSSSNTSLNTQLKSNTSISASKATKLHTVLEAPNVDLVQLRKLAWSGIPEDLRPLAWSILLGHTPANAERREGAMQRKRQEYEDMVKAAFGRGEEGLDSAMMHQIRIDVLRTGSDTQLFQQETVKQGLERILYCWALRHPASGYVQGINDLATPFFYVFLSEHVGTYDQLDEYDVANLAPEVLMQVEADAYGCLTKLVDGIQDNYTISQPGIQRQILRLKELVHRIDAPLYNHLVEENVEFVQFAFRWMNCLLMREMSLRNTIRMWDTYMAETDGFSQFHLYVCAAFLVKWSDQLKGMEFGDILMFLQQLPTNKWDDRDIELLLSEAFMLQTLFHNAQSHLQQT